MPSSPVLLALTTATDTCGVALWQGGSVQVELALQRPRRHGAQLAPLIRDALAHADTRAADLDAVALAAGPGSYTGLRICASTAKGLALATGAALVAVPTLAALAESARRYAAPGDLLCPTLRSRRGEVYAAAFRVQKDDALAPLLEAEALDSDQASRHLRDAREAHTNGDAWLLGSGAPRVATAFPSTDHAPFRIVEKAAPTAGAVAHLAATRLAAGTVEDAAAFEPTYLKSVHATPRRHSVFEGLS